jgi:signal peptidase I
MHELQETSQRRGTPVSPPRRGPDYRLRGLDLDAPAFTDARARPARIRHPRVRRRYRRLVVQWFIALTLIALVAVGLRARVMQPYMVRSSSMVPTLSSGTQILVLKPSILAGPVKAGDIVVFHEPRGSRCNAGNDSSHELVKRVIGLPGETIWSADGSVYINEPGWYNPPFGELGPTEIARTVIPPRSYFVMGDNRTDSCDSRSFGPIPRSLLVGKAVATVARDGHPFMHSI